MGFTPAEAADPTAKSRLMIAIDEAPSPFSRSGHQRNSQSISALDKTHRQASPSSREAA
jgi:hypothetical protein